MTVAIGNNGTCVVSLESFINFYMKQPLHRTVLANNGAPGYVRIAGDMFLHRNTGRRKSKRQLDDPDRHASSRGRSLRQIALKTRFARTSDDSSSLPPPIPPLHLFLLLSLARSLARSLSLFGKTHGHSARPSVQPLMLFV